MPDEFRVAQPDNEVSSLPSNPEQHASPAHVDRPVASQDPNDDLLVIVRLPQPAAEQPLPLTDDQTGAARASQSPANDLPETICPPLSAAARPDGSEIDQLDDLPSYPHDDSSDSHRPLCKTTEQGSSPNAEINSTWLFPGPNDDSSEADRLVSDTTEQRPSDLVDEVDPTHPSTKSPSNESSEVHRLLSMDEQPSSPIAETDNEVCLACALFQGN